MTDVLDPAIAAYYEQAPEETRLAEGAGRIEFARTCELIRRLAPPPPATVLDVGGGPGPYAVWLADLGYEVHLIDPVPRLVSLAERAAGRLPRPVASCRQGDARALDWPDGSADVVLLLGPLYHLPEAGDRARAIAEAFRVLKDGGSLFAAGISRFASALDGLARDLLGEPAFATIIEEDLRSGRHRNPGGRLDWFTTAYFHRPEELAHEVETGGFRLEGLFAIEGPLWLLRDLDHRWSDAAGREKLLQLARSLEREPALLGASAHLLAAARKQG
jgi:ubiquinone/menaquinone biosynthesis C-methylase UbiE